MGGSGGFGGYGYSNMRIREAESSSGAESSQREIDINNFLETLLKEFNDRDVTAINTHLEEIEKTLSKEIDGLEKILFGGSISKNTFIEGTSDVDALVFLDYSKYKNTTPKSLQQIFALLLKKRFPNTEIKKGKLAVTVKFKDYEIQLLPALRNNGKVRIANKDNAGWSSPIDTTAFTQRLTKVNQANSNKVVPVIKLVKNILEKLPNKYKMSGYHIEALAVDAFANYNGRRTLYDMTDYLLKHSVKRVLNPMNDVTGQSGIIDEYLGPSKSVERQKLAYEIKAISGKFSNSNATQIMSELFT